MQLDLLDRKILYELDCNARATFSEIGKTTRTERTVVAYRVKKLEETGIIKSYFTEINNAALGLTGYRVFFKFNIYDKAQEAAFLKETLADKRIAWAYRTTGPWDIDIVYWFKDRFECYELLREIKSNWNSIIQDIAVSTIVTIDHFPKDYLLAKSRKPQPTKKFGKTTYEPTATDLMLLRAIAANGRKDIIKISEETSLAINTIKKHLANLKEKGVILGFRPFLDTAKLGYDYVRVHLHLANYAEKDFASIKHFLEADANVVYLDYYINAADIEIEYQIEQGTLTQKLEELKERFGKHIQRYDIIRFEEEFVARYMPEL